MNAANALVLAGCALGIVVAHSPVAAQVSTRLTADSACPGASALKHTLRGVATVSPSGEWDLLVTANNTTTQVTLIEPEGEVALVRELESGSCDDRAEAVAVILHAHWLDLSLVAPDALAIRRSNTSAVTVNPASEPLDTNAEPEPTPVPAPPAEPVVADERTSGAGNHYTIGLSAAAGIGSGPNVLVGSVRVEAAWKPVQLPIAPRFEVGGRLFEDQSSQNGTLGLRGLTFLVAASVPFELDRVWFAPLIGAGIALDFATFGGLSTTETRMMVTGGVELGWMLARPLWIRVDARVNTLPWADNYLVEPIGEVGRSPQAVFTLGLALGFTFDDS